MSDAVKAVLSEYIQGMKDIYGNHIRKIILYGSYAMELIREFIDAKI